MNESPEEEILLLEIVRYRGIRPRRPARAVRKGGNRYRVNKQHFISETPEITREQNPRAAGLVPTDQYG